MRHINIMEELKSEPVWAYLLAAFLIGIVGFALMTGGFVSG